MVPLVVWLPLAAGEQGLERGDRQDIFCLGSEIGIASQRAPCGLARLTFPPGSILDVGSLEPSGHNLPELLDSWPRSRHSR